MWLQSGVQQEGLQSQGLLQERVRRRASAAYWWLHQTSAFGKILWQGTTVL
jgi:hypothetical protein